MTFHRCVSWLALCVMCAITYSCATGYSQDPPGSRPELLQYADHFYKINDRDVTDFMVEIVRRGILEKPFGGETAGQIMLSIGGGVRAGAFNCSEFYEKIGARNKAVVDQKMASYAFVCRDGSFTKEEALKRFSAVLTDVMDKDYVVDAHWVWFSATGDTQILQRFLDSYLYNPASCHPCVTWSFSSMARYPDVRDYLVQYAQRKPADERLRLMQLIGGR